MTHWYKPILELALSSIYWMFLSQTSEGDQPWDFFGRNDAKAEAPVLWPPHAKTWLIGKDSDAGRDRAAGGERDNRGWDGWMASRTRWMWVWVNSRRWRWTRRPGVLWFTGSRRVGHDWATELNWTELKLHFLWDVKTIKDGLLLGHKKNEKPFAAIWTDLENITLSEVRQKQMSYSISYMWNLKTDTK